MALTPLLHWQMTCQILAAPQQKHAIVHVIAPASKTVSSELTAITDYLTTVGLPFYLPTNLYGESLIQHEMSLKEGLFLT